MLLVDGSVPALEMGVYAHALRWTLRDDLLVFRRIRVIDLGKKALHYMLLNKY